jgi:hypothetical protein
MAKIKLEEVTNKLGVYYHRYAMAETCVNGHELTVENTRTNANGGRVCRTCNRRSGANWRAKNGDYHRQKELARYYQKKAENAKSEVHETPASVVSEGEKG